MVIDQFPAAVAAQKNQKSKTKKPGAKAGFYRRYT
jgi:hypothetical protein